MRKMNAEWVQHFPLNMCNVSKVYSRLVLYIDDQSFLTKHINVYGKSSKKADEMRQITKNIWLLARRLHGISPNTLHAVDVSCVLLQKYRHIETAKQCISPSLVPWSLKPNADTPQRMHGNQSGISMEVVSLTLCRAPRSTFDDVYVRWMHVYAHSHGKHKQKQQLAVLDLRSVFC